MFLHADADIHSIERRFVMYHCWFLLLQQECKFFLRWERSAVRLC